MKYLHIEMSAGIAGDMLLAALLDSTENPEKTKKYLLDKLAKLNLKECVELHISHVFRKGIRAMFSQFKTPEDDWFRQKNHRDDGGDGHSDGSSSSGGHHHNHRNFLSIKKIIENTPFNEKIKQTALKIFYLLAEAEGKIHGQPLEKVHFHEVGSLDAILEIISISLLLEKMEIKHISTTPLILGQGYVHCAHGKMPVPVPAVMAMIEKKKAPFRQLEEITGELTTPTGAAITLSLAQSFNANHLGNLNNISAMKIGYGAGSCDHHLLANVVRVWLIECSQIDQNQEKNNNKTTDEVCCISCVIDDMDGEKIANVVEELYQQGAIDISLQAIIMKKGRPGVKLEMLTKPKDSKRLGDYLLNETSTIGFRHQIVSRSILPREIITIKIENEVLQVKASQKPNGKWNFKVENDSLQKLKKKWIAEGKEIDNIKKYKQEAIAQAKQKIKKLNEKC